MAGPRTPDHGLAAHGPPYTDPQPSGPAPLTAAYPGQLPPPVPYPQRHRRRVVIIAAAALLLVAAMTLAIWYGSQQDRSSAGGPLSDATAKVAIQDYLTALENRDTDAVARNMLCGIYDAVHDRRSDQALAKLSSDAFRKQYSQAQVTSIDKVVYLSSYQAQVLFTMRVKSATGSARDQVQGLAQLLTQHGDVLVCSYMLRTIGAY
jgi:hypothetical protein